MRPPRLHGKVAVITGAGGGIGRATAGRLLQRAMKLAWRDRLVAVMAGNDPVLVQRKTVVVVGQVPQYVWRTI